MMGVNTVKNTQHQNSHGTLPSSAPDVGCSLFEQTVKEPDRCSIKDTQKKVVYQKMGEKQTSAQQCSGVTMLSTYIILHLDVLKWLIYQS